jgi:hypothetical protein
VLFSSFCCALFSFSLALCNWCRNGQQNDILNNDTLQSIRIGPLRVILMPFCRASICHHAEFRFVGCHYAECRYALCHGAQCLLAMQLHAFSRIYINETLSLATLGKDLCQGKPRQAEARQGKPRQAKASQGKPRQANARRVAPEIKARDNCYVMFVSKKVFLCKWNKLAY